MQFSQLAVGTCDKVNANGASDWRNLENQSLRCVPRDGSTRTPNGSVLVNVRIGFGEKDLALSFNKCSYPKYMEER